MCIRSRHVLDIGVQGGPVCVRAFAKKRVVIFQKRYLPLCPPNKTVKMSSNSSTRCVFFRAHELSPLKISCASKRVFTWTKFPDTEKTIEIFDIILFSVREFKSRPGPSLLILFSWTIFLTDKLSPGHKLITCSGGVKTIQFQVWNVIKIPHILFPSMKLISIQISYPRLNIATKSRPALFSISALGDKNVSTPMKFPSPYFFSSRQNTDVPQLKFVHAWPDFDVPVWFGSSLDRSRLLSSR